MAVYEDGFAPSEGSSRLTSIMNVAGALCSLALIAGISVWGYQLIVRDVTGIPVVRAIEGDMRVLPDTAGGGLSLHTGLAVNEVAALGEAGASEDRLLLAPRTTGFAEADLVVTPQADAVAQTIQASLPAEPTQVTETNNTVEELADQLAALATEPPLAPVEQQASTAIDVIPASVPGLARSLRPVARPAGITAPANTEVAVAATALPPGTNLVQLGAFPSPELAAQEWDRLQARFGPLIGDHDRIIQVSNQTSGTWYRLRASGFSDRAAARRLCAALQAENTECIAVVTN